MSIAHEASGAGPATGRNVSLRVDSDVNAVGHATDENVEGGEEEGLSRGIMYSTYSVREAAVRTVAMPSVVGREGKS